MATTTEIKKDFSTPATIFVPRSEPLWHNTAPKAVLQAWKAGDEQRAWVAWTKHLATRKKPRHPELLLSGEDSSLLWALPDPLENSATRQRIVSLHQLPRKGRSQAKQLVQWLEPWLGNASAAPDPAFALEALAWCHALPKLSSQLPAGLWWQLLEALVQTATDAAGIALEAEPLVHQLQAGELPLTLGYLFPEIRLARDLVAGASAALSEGLIELLDHQGSIHCSNLPRVRPLLALWTRCRAIGSETKRGGWSREAVNQYEWFVRDVLRLTRPDGSHVFSSGSSGRWSRELFSAALQWGGNHEDKEIAARVLPKDLKFSRKAAQNNELPEAAGHSEWAELTVLRPEWSRIGPRLTIAFGDRKIKTEFHCDVDVVWSGDCSPQIQFNGKPAERVDDWEEVLWQSDEDVDYLELEMGLSGSLRLQRQIVLARKEMFLFTADVILAPKTGKIDYRCSLPLCSNITFAGSEETREGFLIGSKRRLLVIPLALPEWRSDRRVGSLGLGADGLELRQSATGQAMYAPLFVDLNPRRAGKPLTWRQLTVAEQLEILKPDVAAGYRVQIGNRQWLIYRALTTQGNRTLLGQNFSSEFVLAQFSRSGEVEELIEVE